MRRLTVAKYAQQKAVCDGLCDITEGMLQEKQDLMRCVTCPFCKQVVDALLTRTSISCPECKVTVKR